MASARRPDPKLTPEDLRAKAFRALVRARQWTEKAEALYRTADRRERQREEKISEAWPWPCVCGAVFAEQAQLDEHKKKCSESSSHGHPQAAEIVRRGSPS